MKWKKLSKLHKQRNNNTFNFFQDIWEYVFILIDKQFEI